MTSTVDRDVPRPYGLQTEQRTEPLGVGHRRPPLSRKLECERRGAAQETVRGRVACEWRLADGRITVSATVPPGSTAVLETPTPDPRSVREGDALAADRPGVIRVEPSATGATLWLTSGRYTISALAPDTDSSDRSAIAIPSSQETS